MSRRPSQSRSGVSMLEMVASIVVTSIIAVTVLPLVNGAVDAQSKASAIRLETEGLAFATERMIRAFRDAPAGSTPGTVGITSATASAITLSDGRSFSLSMTDLMMRQGGVTSVLCRNVTALEFTYLGEDGITSTSGNLDLTRRINIRIAGQSTELRSSAFIRLGLTP
jgi:type II secretory pathway pseudopilin PulG